MKELVILDLDGVIIKGQSQQIFLNYLFRKKIVGLFFYLKIYMWFIFYKMGLNKNPKKIMNYAFGSLKGKNLEEVEKLINDFFSEVLNNFIFHEIIDIINKHKIENRELIIVSNALDIIVKKISQFLNIKNYIGTKLEIIDDKFTGNISDDIVYGKNKLKLIETFLRKNKLNLKNSWAYTDHISDLPILKLVKNPFAVNPDKKLCIEAKKNNWPILNFKNIHK
jgi:HAD superfamily hydrolase (TIGR01490 family)